MGGGKGQEIPQSLQDLSGIGLGLAKQVQPGLSNWLNWSQQYATGQRPLESFPFARDILATGGPARQQIEAPYAAAQEKLISQLPEGGIMASELTKMGEEKARDISYMQQGARQQLSNSLLSGGPFMSTGAGLLGAGANLAMPSAQIEAANNAAKGQAKGGMFGGLGQILGTSLTDIGTGTGLPSLFGL